VDATTLSKLKKLQRFCDKDFDTMNLPKFLSKQTLQQGAGVVFDQGLYSLTNFLTGVLLARTLMKEEYGIYVLALSLIITIMGIQRAVITVPYTVYSQKHSEEELNVYTGSVFIHQIILLLITIAFSLLFSKYFFLKEEIPSNTLFMLITFSIAAVGVLLRDFVRSYLLAKLAVRQSVIMGVSVNIVQLLILALLYASNSLTIHSAFFIVGGCSIIPSLYFFLRTSQIRVQTSRIFNDFNNNLKLGKWILGSTIISTLASQSYPWLLVFFADKSAVAILGVTLSLANIFGPLLQGINSYIFPKMAHSRQNDTPSEVIKIMKKAVILLSIIFGLWIICGALFGNHLLALIYSSKYAGYGSVLIIVILSSFISAVTGPLNSALDALERADISFKSLIAGLIVTVSVGIILTYQWGLYGAVIGMLLSNLTNCLLRWRGLFTLINDFKARVANVSLP
jgi:O-antigen/teichoic acid export membrane protein